jgi:N utilization substance protein A
LFGEFFIEKLIQKTRTHTHYTQLNKKHMLDLKTLKAALVQMEEEKKIPQEKILDAIEQSLAAAYKKDYGKKGQIVRCSLDLDSGAMSFFQIKIVADESTVRFVELDENGEPVAVEQVEEGDERSVYNPEKHILIEDAQKIKTNATLDDEIVFPLELRDDFGRVAAQTAKQVIMQRIREAERGVVLDEFSDREGEIVIGTVQKIDMRGNVFVEFGKVTGFLPKEEQIPGESYRQGQRLKTYLFEVEETSRGINLKLSRSHPRFLLELFALEAPEIANGTVEIKGIAREPGNRSKISVVSHDENIDATGSCVGQKGVRVMTVSEELNGEKIDIIEYDENPGNYIAKALSPAQVLDIEVNEEEKSAKITVAEDQLSLAIGKGGQNARLANKLTGWKIDIKPSATTEILQDTSDDESYQSLTSLTGEEAQEEE